MKIKYGFYGNASVDSKEVAKTVLKKAKRSKIDVLKSKKVVDAKVEQLKAVKYPTKTAFKAWLKKMDNRVVGKCQSARACAIATYIQTTMAPDLYISQDYNGLTVGTKAYTVREYAVLEEELEGKEWRLFDVPRWALDFMEAFDGIRGKKKPITGREALAAWTGKA